MTRSQRFSILAAACCAMLLCSAIASANDSTFSVTSFIPKKFVDFQMALSGYLSADGYHVSGSAGRFAGGSYDNQNASLSQNLTRRFETLQRFWTWTLNLGLGYSSHNYEDQNAYQHGRSWNTSPQIATAFDGGAYIFSKLLLSTTCNVLWSYAYSSGPQNIGISDNRYYNVDLLFRPGWGRVYEGNFAATALYMINELKNKGLLLRQPGPREYYELTEIIYQNRLTHSIDSRLHRIDALTQIINYLREHSLIADPGQYGILFLQDVWDYFPTYSRSFGQRVRAGIGLKYTESNSQNSYVISLDSIDRYSHFVRTENYPYLIFSLEENRPYGMRWQFDVIADAKYYLKSVAKENYDGIQYKPTYRRSFQHIKSDYWAYYAFSATAKVRYIADSRTNVLVTAVRTIANQHAHQIEEMSTDNPEIWTGIDYSRYHQDHFNLNVAVEYRISIPTTLRSNLEFTKGVNYNNNNDRDYLNNSYCKYHLSMELVHNFF